MVKHHFLMANGGQRIDLYSVPSPALLQDPAQEPFAVLRPWQVGRYLNLSQAPKRCDQIPLKQKGKRLFYLNYPKFGIAYRKKQKSTNFYFLGKNWIMIYSSFPKGKPQIWGIDDFFVSPLSKSKSGLYSAKFVPRILQDCIEPDLFCLVRHVETRSCSPPARWGLLDFIKTVLLLLLLLLG